MSRRIKVGVVRGGPSAEYDVSLNTGAAVLKAIQDKLADSYETVDVFIDKNGTWHIGGREVAPEDSGRHFDIAWNALHGAYGEDGKIQSLFEAHGIPFTGSGSLASAIGMNKSLTKQILKDAGIKSPYWKEIQSTDVHRDIKEAVEGLFTSFTFPLVVKPVTSGSSVGVSIVRTKAEIAPALAEAAKHGDAILIEEYIPGTEATCGVIDGFRGQEHYALPPVEIKPVNDEIRYVCPCALPSDIKALMEDISKRVHHILQLKHYSRSDFIVHPRRGIYFLGVNTSPRMNDESLIHKALHAVGSDLHELIDHIIRRELGV